MTSAALIAEIQAATAAVFDISADEMRSARRQRVVAHPRQVAMYLSYQQSQRSLASVGRSFGGRHHTTVLYAIEQVGVRIEHDPVLRNTVAEIAARAQVAAQRRSIREADLRGMCDD